MKKGLMILALSLLAINLSSALCTLTPSLINQDPSPSVPGETVKLLFQLSGTENPECGIISLEFIEEYPFTLDPAYSKVQTIKGGTYQRDFNNFWMIPYKVRVDPNALDGDQKISLKTWINLDSQLAKINDFNISVDDVRTDFIVTIDSYSFSTNKLVLGVVNIGENVAESITVELPEQANAMVEGGHVKILGELDSNEDTTVAFDASLLSGPITVKLEYNDEIGERRILTKEVLFSEIAFESTREKSSVSLSTIIFWVAVIALIAYYFIRKARRRRRMDKNR